MGGLAAAIRVRLRDASLLGRELKKRTRGLYGPILEAWRKASPGTYRGVRGVVRRKQASVDAVAELPAYGSVVTVDGLRMRVDERMTSYQVKKLVAGRHTQEERQLIPPRLRPDDIVMELGGGIGMLAIACAKAMGPSGRVHSYEANPTLEPLIRDNYALNGVAPHLKMCMLGREAGTRTFHLARHFSRSSTYKTDDAGQAVDVPVEPLNAEIARVRPTVLVVDIQGGETELLPFADLRGVRMLLVETHPDLTGIPAVNELRRHVREAGFEEATRSEQSYLYVRPEGAPVAAA